MSAARLYLLWIVLSAAGSIAAAPAVLFPGRWQITIRPELPVAAPEMTTEVCIADPTEHVAPPRGRPADDCQVTGSAQPGNVLSYAVRCAKRDAASSARFTFNGNRYDGVVEGRIDGRNFRQVYTAVRLGDCPDEPLPPARP